MGSHQQASKQQAMFARQLAADCSSNNAAGAESVATGLPGRRGNLNRSAGRAQGTSAAVADAADGVASTGASVVAAVHAAAAMHEMGPPPQHVALVAAPAAQHVDEVEAPAGEDMAEGLVISRQPRTRAPVALKRKEYRVEEDRVLRQRIRSCYAQPAVNSKHASMLSYVLC